MKKPRIVIASVLKPVDDTRMLEKMAMTLNATGKYEVFIIGYPSQRPSSPDSIHLLPLKAFRRISPGRLFASLKIFRKIYQVKPESLIVNTHELLIVAIVNRILFGTKIMYDIRENYYRNVLDSEAFPIVLRPFLAGWVRVKEKMTAPFFHGFLLAEKGYKQEMSFFGKRAIVIENKAIVPSGFHRKKEAGKIRLLFSGTLAASTGIFETIRLAKELHALEPGIQLKIIGYAALTENLERIHFEVRGESFISLVGGDQLVPHAEIVEAIFSSDFGVVVYPASRHTENSIPTKLYEYLACSLPILLQSRPSWLALCLPFRAEIPVDFHNLKAHDLLLKMRSATFYDTLPENVTWETEGRRLVAFLEGGPASGA